MNHLIPEKANRVLNVILFAMILILIRVWYLAVIQHDAHVALAHKPQRRTSIRAVERATIRDRFNIPMALNQIEYAAAVCYADIRSIPRAKWITQEDGTRIKIFPRSEYIQRLSQLLAQELGLNEQDVEDTIHAKASLFPHTAFTLKEGISEELYYRLKFLESQWIGIRTEKKSRRHYPLHRVGSDIVGYMGAINSQEYHRIAKEMRELSSYLAARESGELPVLPKGFSNPLEVDERLKHLQERSYSIHDLIGKAGVEATFDEELRGYAGKTIQEIDTKGNPLRELPGSRPPIPGQRLLLSISSELQEYAEQLLADHEQFREVRHPDGTPTLTTPWIRGGAIVALNAKTGEVLALASYPRFDPNDFLPSRNESEVSPVLRWLESEAYIGEIWDGKRPMERERFDHKRHAFYDETLDLTWNRYLEAILPLDSSLFNAMHQIRDLSTAYQLQAVLDELLTLSQQSSMKVLMATLYSAHRPFRKAVPQEEIKTASEHLAQTADRVTALRAFLDRYLSPILYLDDQLLAIDLCRMIAPLTSFSPDLLQHVGSHSLNQYRHLSQKVATLQHRLRTHVKKWFHAIDFQQWRNEHFKTFLASKRKMEKEKKQHTRPYTEYLEQLEKTSFNLFWERYRFFLLDFLLFGKQATLAPTEPALQPYFDKIALLQEETAPLIQALSSLTPQVAINYLQTMRTFSELKQPLYGFYRSLRNTQGEQLEKHLAAAFYPLTGYGYGRSHAFRQSTPLGSVFKLVVGYQALLEQYQKNPDAMHDLNPLTLIDDQKAPPSPGSPRQQLGRFLDGTPIYRLYKGGLLPRKYPNVGQIDLIGAIEQSSNIYFSILASDFIESPWNLIEACRLFGLGERSGIELPGEIGGILPDDLSHNRTGLYSFAIGQHTLIATPLQTAVMLTALANKGDVLTPKIVQIIAGHEPPSPYRDPFDAAHYPYQDALSSIGIDFPLFTGAQTETPPHQVWYSSPEIKRSIYLPDILRNPLLEGMHRVINGPRGTARPHIIRFFNQYPATKKNYLELKNQIVGKTGTAEILYKHTIDAESTAQIHNHIWFGGISLSPASQWTKIQAMDPELVVVVYLRLSSSGGKETAPLATEIVKKWREICAKHSVVDGADGR